MLCLSYQAITEDVNIMFKHIFYSPTKALSQESSLFYTCNSLK